MDSNVIYMPTSCTIIELEKSIRCYYKKNDIAKKIIFDLSKVKYIEAPSIIFLLGYIDQKITEHIDVQISLPEKKEIRDLLRYFRFPIILSSLTKAKFHNLVTPESLKYFGENRNLQGDYWEFAKKKKFIEFDNLSDSIATNRVFCESIPFKETFEKNNALEKLHFDWTGEEMMAFLKQHLNSYERNKEKLVPNRIIYECVTNSQRHSNADKLVFAAIVKKEKKGKSEPSDLEEYIEEFVDYFDISFWDNGDSIIETLKRAIDKGEPVKDMELQKDEKINRILASFYIKYEDCTYNKKIINSDIDPKEFSDDRGMLLLSSFFPGVSKDPKGLQQWKPSPEFENEDTALKHPGMGLTTLLNAVIDLLGGQVSVRVENYFLNIKKPQDKEVINELESFQGKKFEKFYQAKLSRYEKIEPMLKGNMLTVRLPLRNVE